MLHVNSLGSQCHESFLRFLVCMVFLNQTLTVFKSKLKTYFFKLAYGMP